MRRCPFCGGADVLSTYCTEFDVTVTGKPMAVETTMHSCQECGGQTQTVDQYGEGDQR